MKTSLRCNQSAELQCLSPDAYQGHKQERLLLLTSLLVATQPRPAPWPCPMERRLVGWESPPWPSYTGPHPEPGCGSRRRPWSQHSQQGTPHPPCDSPSRTCVCSRPRCSRIPQRHSEPGVLQGDPGSVLSFRPHHPTPVSLPFSHPGKGRRCFPQEAHGSCPSCPRHSLTTRRGPEAFGPPGMSST